jgi:hypothetical protein
MLRLSPRFFGLCAAAAALCPCLAGCGGASRTEVTGKVTYNGKPIERAGGTIAFLGSDGVPVVAAIETTGDYHAAGVCLGDNKVTVSYTSTPPGGSTRKRVPGRMPEPPKAPPESPFLIPSKYAVPETSGLTVVVEKNTVYNPELTGPNLK